MDFFSKENISRVLLLLLLLLLFLENKEFLELISQNIYIETHTLFIPFIARSFLDKISCLSNMVSMNPKQILSTEKNWDPTKEQRT